ncbi:hypothetical protein ACQP3L_39075, partial [Escherichia coli]
LSGFTLLLKVVISSEANCEASFSTHNFIEASIFSLWLMLFAVKFVCEWLKLPLRWLQQAYFYCLSSKSSVVD